MKEISLCLCGKKPKLKARNIWYKANYYACSCGVETFATGQESCSRELWNAAVKFKKEKK